MRRWCNICRLHGANILPQPWFLISTPFSWNPLGKFNSSGLRSPPLLSPPKHPTCSVLFVSHFEWGFSYLWVNPCSPTIENNLQCRENIPMNCRYNEVIKTFGNNLKWCWLVVNVVNIPVLRRLTWILYLALRRDGSMEELVIGRQAHCQEWWTVETVRVPSVSFVELMIQLVYLSWYLYLIIKYL